MAEIAHNLKSMKGVEMTLKVNLTKQFRLRLFVGLGLIRLGARITGMNVRVEKIDADKLGEK